MADMKEQKTASEEAPSSPYPTSSPESPTEAPRQKRSVGQRLLGELKKPGSALQIVIAATLAIAIGLSVSSTVEDIPASATALVGIPGDLWLRALKAIVLPLIITAMILAVQRLRELSGSGKKLALWTIGWYVVTTFFAIIQSSIMVSQVWQKLMSEMSTEEQDSAYSSEEEEEEYTAREDTVIHEVVVQMFESLIPENVVESLSTDDLLAVIIMSIVIGYLIPGPQSYILKLVVEVERIVTIIITFLIKCAPIGVFFLILPNIFSLDPADIGKNLGVLIGGAISDMFIHLFIVLPLMFFIATKTNPYVYWFRNSPAWITAWGTASSAATLSVTLQCAKDRGIPNMVAKFALPLGALINMDGTAIYFPVIVVFMATTQGISLGPADYIIICLLSTLASIGTTPIPSSSLVLTVMIAGAVNVPVSGSYALAVAFDWFLDRFRTATNVSGDLYAVGAVTKLGKFADPDDDYVEEDNVGSIRDNDSVNHSRV